MCDPFGTKAASKSARNDAARAERETKAKEAKRQADIKLGGKNIDSAFKQYNPSYFDKFKSTFTGNFNPQIDQQYTDATDKLTAALAGRGVLDSSVGANKFAEAKRVNDQARIDVANDAASAAGDLQSRVAGRKGELFALNQSTADPQGIMAQATGAATALAAPPQYSPLGDLFANVLSTYQQFQQARANSPGARYSYKPSSSYKVVN